MKKVVILQPCFLPWLGTFEQIKLADVYVHYDDVQMPTGASRINRIQIKTPLGGKWLTAPIHKDGLQNINQISFDSSQDWRSKHLSTFKHVYGKAKCWKEAEALLLQIYARETDSLCEFDIFAIELLTKYFEIECEFVRSSTLNNSNLKSTERLLDITQKFGGDIYITGLGAKNYIKYDMFERAQIKIEFMDYLCTPYPQINGDFTPYVTAIDAIANLGKDSIQFIHSPSIYWRDFIKSNH